MQLDIDPCIALACSTQQDVASAPARHGSARQTLRMSKARTKSGHTCSAGSTAGQRNEANCLFGSHVQCHTSRKHSNMAACMLSLAMG